MSEIIKNEYVLLGIMAVIVFLVTQALKLSFIKPFTKKIGNERVRRMVNATILLIPFATGILLDVVYSSLIIHTSFSIITGLGYGTAGISLYGVIERFFKVKVDNPYDSEEGKAVTDLVAKVAKDGKIDSKDHKALEDFYKFVKK